MMFSKFIHVHQVSAFDFMRLNNSPLYAKTTACLPIHPLMDTWVIFHFWAIKNKAARDFPEGPVLKTSTNAGGTGLIPS